MAASSDETKPTTVLDLVTWALRADVRSDSERKIGRWHIKAALVALATHASAETHETFVSAARIARDIGVSERDARLLIAALEAQTLVIVDRSRKPHRRRLACGGIPADRPGGIPADHHPEASQRITSPDPQADPQGDPQASQHLSDPIGLQPAMRAPARGNAVNDYEVTQVAKVAAALEVDEATATDVIRRWALHRPDVRSPFAVIARMTADATRAELGRYVSKAPPRRRCPEECAGLARDDQGHDLPGEPCPTCDGRRYIDTARKSA